MSNPYFFRLEQWTVHTPGPLRQIQHGQVDLPHFSYTCIQKAFLFENLNSVH
jgi:hypothetical protein